MDFRDATAMARAADARSYPPERRAAMASVLKSQAERIGFGEVSRASLARFADPRAVVVVAGTVVAVGPVVVVTVAVVFVVVLTVVVVVVVVLLVRLVVVGTVVVVTPGGRKNCARMLYVG